MQETSIRRQLPILKGTTLPEFAVPPLAPIRVVFDVASATADPAGPILTRRMSSLEGLFEREDLRREFAAEEDPIVYTVASSPVPELPRELPQSVTTILSGSVGGELYMTKGHQHPDPQGEIYLGLTGVGGVLMFNGEETAWIDIEPGVIGYIPPGWAHRSVNTGSDPYQFLAVYPGSAGHDYGWVLENGMGERIFEASAGIERRPYTFATDTDR